MDGFKVGSDVMDVQIHATSGRGHSVDEMVEFALSKIMYISKDAPAPIKDQAIAFRDRIKPILKQYMVQACKSDRTTIYNILKDAGQHDAAALILKL